MTVNLNDVKSAVREERTITFLYNGEVRTIKATDVHETSNPYVIGRDVNRNEEFRRFTLEKMTSMAPVL